MPLSRHPATFARPPMTCSHDLQTTIPFFDYSGVCHKSQAGLIPLCGNAMHLGCLLNATGCNTYIHCYPFPFPFSSNCCITIGTQFGTGVIPACHLYRVARLICILRQNSDPPRLPIVRSMAAVSCSGVISVSLRYRSVSFECISCLFPCLISLVIFRPPCGPLRLAR
jgi:hypothetical protein